MTWLLNHTAEPAEVQRGPAGRDLLDDRLPVRYPLVLEPLGVKVIAH